MKEFYQEYYTVLTKLFELIAVLTGIILYKKYKHTNVKYFIWFLVWVVVLELIGTYPRYFKDFGLSYLIEGTIFERNTWWFTLAWTTSSTLFYSWFLGMKINSILFKRIIKYACGIYLLILVGNMIFYFEEFFKIRPLSLVIGNIIIILMSSIFFLYEVLNSDKILTFYRSIYFYVGAIIFIWWLIFTPLRFFVVYNTTADWDYVVLKWTVKLCANIFMYLGFTFALIISKPEYD